MTVDSNHLRRLLAEMTPTPWISLHGIDGPITLDGTQIPVSVDDVDGIAALRNNAVELLDRSDALDEALRLLRRADDMFTKDWPYVWFERPGTAGHDIRAFLARFQGEAA